MASARTQAAAQHLVQSSAVECEIEIAYPDSGVMPAMAQPFELPKVAQDSADINTKDASKATPSIVVHSTYH